MRSARSVLKSFAVALAALLVVGGLSVERSVAAGELASYRFVLVVMTNKGDVPTNTEVKAAAQQAADFWREQSDGRITSFTVANTVVRYETAHTTATGCGLEGPDREKFTAEGLAKAGTLQAGDQAVMVVPASCRLGGIAGVSGSPIVAAATTTLAGTIAHEFGHNIGLEHSPSALCAATCPVISSSEEYGDYGSVMGGGLAGFTGLSALNSSIRDALDWVKPGEQQEFLLPHGQHSASQEFTLYPRSGSTGVRSVKIHDTGTVGYYFAEFRTPEDGNVWGNTPGWASGVSLVYRSRDGLNYRHHWLQKIGPDAKLTMTSGDPAFTNPTGSLKVEVLDATASSARIRLTLTAVGDDYAPAPVLTVTGKKVVGMAVKANLGNPSPAFTKVLYQWRRDGALILGALGTPITGENYSFRAEDIGAQITVTVTASAPGHRAVTLVSDPITDVSWLDPQTPTVRALDPPSAGSYAEAVTGNWGEEVSFSYQWYVDGAKAGTKWNLLLTKAMVGKRVRVEVTGTRGGQSQTRSSAETVEVAPAAWAPTKPVIKGTPRYPGTLSIDEPDWGTAFVGYRYVWLKDGAYLKQYGRTLKLTPGMVGHKISIQVNGDAEGPAVWRISAPVVIDGKKLASGKVKVRGKATVGKKLTAVTGTWTAGARFKYQWYAGSKAIKKATKSTYTVTSAVKGKKLRVKITGTKTGYVPKSVYSAYTAVVK